MADTYFVSSADGNNGDSGLTLDLAWATIEYALESGGLSAGDTVVIRRGHSEIPVSDISPAYDGEVDNPIIIAGCPRSAHAISSSDWTNGSTGVVVDDADMARAEHQARYITAPDGNRYFITRVTDASNIVIDREYAGSTSSNDATASIDADTPIAGWTAYSDPGGETIAKADWDADADTLPLIDFNDGDIQFYFSSANFIWLYCVEVKDSADSNGIIRINNSGKLYFEGLLIKQSAENKRLLYIGVTDVYIKRCVIEASGSGNYQQGVTSNSLCGSIIIEDCAIYNMGDCCIYAQWMAKLKNVNLGVEIASQDADIVMPNSPDIQGSDVRFGGTNGIVRFEAPTRSSGLLSIENFQKTLGEHRTYYHAGYYEKVAVSGETPNKKVSDNVIKIIPNVNWITTYEFAPVMLTHEIDGVTTGSKTFKYWIYNDTGATLNDTTALDNIWLKAEYVDSYDDTTEYTQLEGFSTEIDILDAADADDWDYLQVTLTPATTSKVRLTIYFNYYNATTNLIIDPSPVIT